MNTDNINQEDLRIAFDVLRTKIDNLEGEIAQAEGDEGVAESQRLAVSHYLQLRMVRLDKLTKLLAKMQFDPGNVAQELARQQEGELHAT